MNKFKLSSLSLLLAGTTLLTACSNPPESVDLDRVLDVTAASLDRFENGTEKTSDAAAMDRFAKTLQTDMNQANPKIHSQPIGIALKEDGSIQGYNDENANSIKDSGEIELFKVEIDSEKNRLLASSGEDVRDHRFSGTSLMAGLLIGHLLSRQRGAGVNPKSLSNKQAMSKTSYSNARSRSGSGSHSSGK